MRNLRDIWSSTMCLARAVAGATPTWAQTVAAQLRGVITDQSKAVIQGVNVRIMDLGTNRILETKSVDTVAWSFPLLPPGDYGIEVSKGGFRALSQNTTLQVAQGAM